MPLHLVLAFLLLLLPIESGLCTNTDDFPKWRTPASQRLVETGLDEIMNYRLAVAEAKFDSLIRLEPDRPEGHFFKSHCYFWRYLLGERERDYDQFRCLIDSSFARSEKYLDAHASDKKARALATYFLAESHLSLAFAQARSGNYVGAVFNIHRSKGLYKEALSIDSTCYDAAKGVGLFGFFSSLIPSSVQWLSSIFGYEGNQERGLALLEVARQKSRYSRQESAYYLAMIDFMFYKNYHKAEQALRSLTVTHPHSTLLNYSLGLVYLETKLLGDASRYFSLAAFDRKSDPQNAFSAYAIFRLGELSFRKNDFDAARNFFEEFASVSNFSVYQAQLHYHLGLCNELQNNRRDALQHYKQAKAKSDNDDELFSQRRAATLMNAPLSDAQRIIYLGRNAVDAGNYEKALQFLLPITEKSNDLTKDDLAEAHYHLARCYDETGNDEKAVAHYQICYKLFPQKERYLAPFSRYRLGLIYARQKKYDLARDEFEKAQRYISYDYELKLKRDIKQEMKKLEAEKKASASN
jgi:tetratricopeptide (TPR) repeat protein